MNSEQFRAWRKRHYRSQAAAGRALGLSAETIANYEAGRRRDGRIVKVPKTVALACAALSLGITRYEGPQE